jgi:hypothetical protein
MEVAQAIQDRRAVREYTDQPVDKATVTALLRAAPRRRVPSTNNLGFCGDSGQAAPKGVLGSWQCADHGRSDLRGKTPGEVVDQCLGGYENNE